MQCPVCKGVQLVMAERQGVEIDYCPQCRGVWLDRGELDKIIERSPQDLRSAQQAPAPSSGQTWGRSGDHCDDPRQPGHRKSFWKDLFD
ncbi:zf-TFIIB domain-containing protein [Rhodanobacter denitrificans]|uniref:TFIIB-type zinc ribbon-containing protein n=1 Tax=Rhodanobacter denitrificans TaxID=666685 RepID=UPI001F300147|nr:zf-TFIIB domain-containing protein [Rhodanobacter denitrificans]UJJ58316.1 zf-TFIIB domain-containing protein [Rhodanobacter denitrificans]